MEYIERVQKALVTQAHFKENPEKPGLPLRVKDGIYPLLIDKWDLVEIRNDRIKCGNFNQFIPATLGYFRRDKSGLWHYILSRAGGIRTTFTPDALQYHPKDAAAMFWFNEVPAPMHFKDDHFALARRSEEWFENLRKCHAFFRVQFESIQVNYS